MKKFEEYENDPLLRRALAERDREWRFVLITATILASVVGILLYAALEAFAKGTALGESSLWLAILVAAYIWNSCIKAETERMR